SGDGPSGSTDRTIVFTGMGSSYHACYVPVTSLAEAGAPAVMVDAAELLHFRRPMLDGRSVLIAVTQSGESAEVVRLVEDEWPAGRAALALLGRGAARAAAEMGALLMKEVARFPAESLESGQFRHGPLELAGPDLAVVVVATEPATAGLDARLTADLLRAGAG